MMIMFAPERQQLILSKAREEGRVDVADLSESLNVTTETVRRDLNALAQQGTLKRVHGGAVPVERFDGVPNLTQRADIMSAAKRAIAKRARRHLPRAEGSILIDAGTTTALLAEAIPPDLTLTALTNAAPTAEILVRKPMTTVFLLGGRVRPETLATVDAWTVQQLEKVAVDVAFIGAYGISVERGVSTQDPSEAVIKRAMIKSAKKVVLLADRTKLGHDYFSVFADVDDIDVLVTDSGAAKAQLDELRAVGFEIDVAGPERGATRESR